VLAHIVHAVTDDGGDARFGKRGKAAGFQRVIQAVGEIVEGVDERSVKVEYASFTMIVPLSFPFVRNEFNRFFYNVDSLFRAKDASTFIAPSICQTGLESPEACQTQ
jgi:hypothetical protein